MMSRKLLFGLLAVFLAIALGVASLPPSWGFLTAAQNNSVFCSSAPPAETLSAAASVSRTVRSCPPAITRS